MNKAMAHPQANGLVERANKSLIEGIKARLGRERAGWVDELPNIGMPTHRTMMIREDENEDEVRLNMDLLQERREATAIREAKYKTKMEQYYNQKVFTTPDESNRQWPSDEHFPERKTSQMSPRTNVQPGTRSPNKLRRIGSATTYGGTFSLWSHVLEVSQGKSEGLSNLLYISISLGKKGIKR
ncbi:reverse transcriptase domain-containing protein [Tanacetum coccineum]